ncbi:MAG: class I SAM-dependent methyltransferase [Cyclobacteriaceae bacterium]
MSIFKRIPVERKNVSKYDHELNFWKGCIKDYRLWYKGEVELYETKPPTDSEKIRDTNPDYAAILTWLKLHQEKKYILDLELDSEVFRGKRVLDVGSGPLPSAQVFEGCELYCLDPLIPKYLEAGYPMHIYDQNVRFAYGHAENMPFPENFFDVVISVNALDHVDDFKSTANEINRVLKKDGNLRFHLHYHSPTITEPLVLNDNVVAEAFQWAQSFRKINQKQSKTGYTAPEGEYYTLWSNF